MDESKDTQSNIEEDEADRVTAIHAVKSFLLALGLLVVGILVMIVFVWTKPEPEKKESSDFVPSVRVAPVVVGRHHVVINTQGAVRSLQEVTLSAEVSGRVMGKSPKLLEGAMVQKGDSLVKIDAADYDAAVARAASAVAEAELALKQEAAMSVQAKIDWEKLGEGEPSSLVLRKPQLKSAMARLESAKSEFGRAKRDVERATIAAPFDARVRRVSVELGAVLAPGTPVAELYSANQLEVKLPFSLMDYGFLRESEAVEVELTASVGGELKKWPAVLERVDGEVQRSTLSAYGLARVKPAEDGSLPPVGLFVEASVPGMILNDVVLLPRVAVRGADEVWVVNDGLLAKRKITILRSGDDQLIVKGNFRDGDQLVLTRLAVPMVGAKVEVVDSENEDS